MFGCRMSVIDTLNDARLRNLDEATCENKTPEPDNLGLVNHQSRRKLHFPDRCNDPETRRIVIYKATTYPYMCILKHL